MMLVISNIGICWVMTEEFIGTVKNCPVVKRRTKIIIISNKRVYSQSGVRIENSTLLASLISARFQGHIIDKA